jgi:hypothetical protein
VSVFKINQGRVIDVPARQIATSAVPRLAARAA